MPEMSADSLSAADQCYCDAKKKEDWQRQRRIRSTLLPSRITPCHMSSAIEQSYQGRHPQEAFHDYAGSDTTIRNGNKTAFLNIEEHIFCYRGF